MSDAKGSWKEKTLNIRISEEEHRAIKTIAFEREQTIKDVVFAALEVMVPGWKEKGIKK